MILHLIPTFALALAAIISVGWLIYDIVTERF